ncbi:uracil-DNA glycosylase [Nakamurella alba]|uniref:uracil-DNA glycosylase n=1 Tax=Nakamurella alba TaxID=2665158 RepID=UPI002AC327F4|nr:uracil-DNA glycosylase [Nakamurella alba]
MTGCRRCPRLVAWREQVAGERRAAYRDQTYWGRAVPGFGPADARVLVVGLAPAAHGANRTGRMFTGDRSGDVLFAALHRAGFASQAASVSADDGMQLDDLRITAPVHCAPPDNRPLPSERDHCRPYLVEELRVLGPRLQVIVTLGAFGWTTTATTLQSLGWQVPRPRPVFGHGAVTELRSPTGSPVHLVGSYHVSQQNTFTGRLTPAMLDEVFTQVRALLR